MGLKTPKKIIFDGMDKKCPQTSIEPATEGIIYYTVRTPALNGHFWFSEGHWWFFCPFVVYYRLRFQRQWNIFQSGVTLLSCKAGAQTHTAKLNRFSYVQFDVRNSPAGMWASIPSHKRQWSRLKLVTGHHEPPSETSPIIRHFTDCPSSG